MEFKKAPMLNETIDTSASVDTINGSIAGMTNSMDNSTVLDLTALLESGPVYMYMAERIILATYLFIMSICSTLINCIFMFLVFTNSVFHTPYMAILVCMCITDILVIMTTIAPPMVFLIIGKLPLSGRSPSCLILRVFYVSIFISQNYSIAFLSIERLLYFYKPLVYERLFSIRNIILFELVFLLVSVLWVTLTSLDGEVYASPMSLSCTLYGLDYYLPVHVFLIYGPVCLIVLVSIGGLLRLISKHKRAISDQMQQVQAGQEEVGTGTASGLEAGTAAEKREPITPSRNLITNIKTGIRIVACMSATYYLTYFPIIFILYIFLNKINIVDLELGNAATERLIMRILYFSLALGNVFNSFVYICTNKQLKQKMLRLLKISGSSPEVSEHTDTTQVAISHVTN